VIEDGTSTGHQHPARVAKVVLMIGQLGPGGTEKQVALLARGLQERGVHVSVWVLYRGTSHPRADALRRDGVAVVDFGLRRDRDVRDALPNAVRLARMVARLRRERPDVVHAFLFRAYVLAAPAARMARVPVVVAGRRSLGIFKQGRERVSEGKITVVANGLPAQAFGQVPPADIGTRQPAVACVANLVTHKGHRYLLDAMRLLADAGRPCTLLLAGDGPQRRALERQAARLGIDVRFLGVCGDVRPVLARADVVAHPSLEEGMSNAVMEAMALACPIVATRAGGTPELLCGRGLLVPAADPAALAAGVESLLADRALAVRLGAAARNWCRENLSATVMVDQHVRIYSELLRRPCAG
jgi:glycosyltransferase involved in cell wall biosynthesis